VKLFQGKDNLGGVKFRSNSKNCLLILAKFVLDGQKVKKLSSWTILKHKVELLLVLKAPIEFD
jgi:hypothetical protein